MSSATESSVQWRQAANQSVLRASFNSSSAFASNAALQQLLDAEEHILHEPILVTRVQRRTPPPTETEHHENGGARDACQGRLVVTSDRLMFWGEKSDESDAIVPAACIDLHAIQSPIADYGSDDGDDDQDAPGSIYIQMRSDSECSEPDLIEWTIAPSELPANDHMAVIGTLYDALSELVSLHPIDPNDGIDDGDDDDDEMIIAPAIHASGGDAEAAIDERDAMLARLDGLLVVPKEFERSGSETEDDGGKSTEETAEGQFDDAEDDDEVDALL